MFELNNGFELAYPLWLLLLPLPLAVFYLLPAYTSKQQAIKVPFFALLSELIGEQPLQGAASLSRRGWQKFTLLTSWVLVVLAMCKPIILSPPQLKEQSGRDIMVVVDLSGSMSEQDFTDQQGQLVSRLIATKQVLHEFVKTREGDRLGLILFGDAAFLQTPFTPDHKVWLSLLEQTEVAMAGQSTHLGDAIGLAIKVFSQQKTPVQEDRNNTLTEKVAIVLTDGNDTESLVPPLDAAKVAKAKGVRIHLIAMGDPKTVGEKAINMAMIKNIAQTTGGEAFQALDKNALLAAYQAINQLEPKIYKSTHYRNKQSIHHYLIMLVLVLNMLAFIIAYRLRLSRQRGSNDA